MTHTTEPMQQFVGVKLVNAKPMTRGEYNEYRNWNLPENENGEDQGMLVEYLDGGRANTAEYKGYVSWSPLDVFQKAYGLASNLTFGLAMQVCKQGAKIRRADWKEPDMWIVLVPGNGRPVRAIKRSLQQDGANHIRVRNQLGRMGFTVNRRAPTNIDKLLIGLPKNMLNELAHSLTQG
jgi:hypothetical protein